jgi:hypothetical protein
MRLIATVVAVLMLVAPVAAGAGQTPLAADSQQLGAALGRRPRLIVYFGDGAAFLAGRGRSTLQPGRLRWTTWTSSDARAWGADWHNDHCRPSCVGDTFVPFPINLHLYRPRMLGGHLVFTRMTVTYTSARPPRPAFQQRSLTARLQYSTRYGPAYSWNT